jgi:hypothetical protein
LISRPTAERWAGVFLLTTWVTALRRLLFALGATTAFASTAGALSVTLATTSVIGAGSVHPSGEPINVAIGDRIRYALIASNPTGESITVLVTTIFYDPAQLTLISSSGDMRPFLKGPGFVMAGMWLVSAPGLKEGVPGELVAVARASQLGAIGLGPDLAATLEFEVLDDSNPINVVQGFGVGDPRYWSTPRPSLLVPEPTGALLIGVLALLGQQSRRLQRKPRPHPPTTTRAARAARVR